MDIFKGKVPANRQQDAYEYNFRSRSLGGVVSADEVVDGVRVSNALLQRRGISEIVFLELVNIEIANENLSLTMNITRPKSPVTFRCRFAISSRNGTITVHP
jgi:hypothetical protein